MDVWTLYLSSHNGKQPRNAFDLVNFSRTTEHTLTFKKAKQIYQENIKLDRDQNIEYHNGGGGGDHYLAPTNHVHSEDDEPPILKSPKHMKKRKASYSSNSRRNSKISKHKQSISRDSYKANNTYSTTKFNEDAVLKESEDINYSEMHKMYTSTTSISITEEDDDENGIEQRQKANDMDIKLKSMRIKAKHVDNNRHKLEKQYRETDSEGDESEDSEEEEDEYNIYKRKRRTKNQSSPISLNRRNYSHQISKSQTIEQSKSGKRTRAQGTAAKAGNRLNNLRYTKHKSEKYRIKPIIKKEHKKKKKKKKKKKHVSRVIVASSPRYIQRQRKKAQEREKEKEKEKRTKSSAAPSSASSSSSSSSKKRNRSRSVSNESTSSNTSSSSSSSSTSATSSSSSSSSSSRVEAINENEIEEIEEHKLKLRSYSRSSDTNRRHQRVQSGENHRVKKDERNKWKNKRKSTMQIPLKKAARLKQRNQIKKGRKSQNLIVNHLSYKKEEEEKEKKRKKHRKHKKRELKDENDGDNRVPFKRSSSADPRTILTETRNKKVKPRPARIKKQKQKANKKNKIELEMSLVSNEILRAASVAILDDDLNKNGNENENNHDSRRREKHSKFRVGDVVLVSFAERGDDLARIRFYGQTVLDSTRSMFGIECFKLQFNSHLICGFRVNDGSIAGGDKLFEVKKIGYGSFIKYDDIKSHKCLWNLKMSKHALKLSEFDSNWFLSAAKYGSLKVIKHLLRILLKKHGANKTNRARSGSTENGANIYATRDIQTIETGFGYSVLNNHTKIVKMILTHFGSNNTSFTTMYFNRSRSRAGSRQKRKSRSAKKKTKSLTDFVIKNDIKQLAVENPAKPSLRSRTSSGASSVSSIATDSDFDDEYDEDDHDDEAAAAAAHFIRNGMSKFYSSHLFDLVCEQRNFQMLQILIEYDSWPLLSPSSRGLYGVFCRRGYLKWIKYLLEISPYILNMPLLSNNIDSTMMITSICHNNLSYTKYILSSCGARLQFAAQRLPILLIVIMNLNAHNLSDATDIIRSILLHCNDCNWCPAAGQCLKNQLRTAHKETLDLIDEQYCDHQLTYYHLDNGNQMEIILGSVLAAFCYKSVTIYRDSASNDNECLHYLSDLLSTFMLYGIDFNQKNEFQHVWMTYDGANFRWNISNFPYNVCNTKKELLFLQKMFKKALRKYPIKLLNTCEMILIDHHPNNPHKYELIEIFKKYIIPFSIYDALIFESLHFCAPNESDLDLSEPESVDFMFAYQRSPVVE